MNNFAILILSFVAFYETEAGEVSCRLTKAQMHHYDGVVTPNQCYMDETKTIDAPGFTFLNERNETIQGLEFFHNDKIQFLPERIAEKFPNLNFYDAMYCRVKKVSKINFQGLFKLTYVYLSYNKIEKLASDTFEDSIALKLLQLSKIY